MTMNSISQDHSKLGFIGIGAMGLRIAGRLLKNGFQVSVFDRNTAKANALIESGGTVTHSIAELASGADVVLSSLPNDDVVRSVYNGPQGVLGHIRRGSMIIEMSTVSPETSRELYRLASALGVSVLDVPVSGSTPAAEQGLLTLLGGGDEDSFNAAQAIFTAIGRQHFYLGPSGSGNTMKLVVNTLLGVGMQAIAEAVVLGEKSGLDRQRLFDVLSKTAVVAPAHLGKLTKALEHDYRREFAVGLMNKDFRLILKTALAVRAPMPAAAAAFPINDLEFADHPDYDFCAVIDRMEDMANVNLARQETHGEIISPTK
jgi:3-hydroxyisobutyrate dehydrogenase-like beta-hydroxyacid dehydrogenase